MSKRKLLQLVTEKRVSGWDDPRMPTLVGMRRRGYPAAAIRTFCERIGVGKADSRIDLSVLEECVREQLNETAPRRQAVLDPLKVVITNLPEDEVVCTAANHPQKPELGERQLLLTREIYIERSDFMEDPPKKFFRLGPGREVRLRNACIIRCDEIVRDENGAVIELICSCDPDTFGAKPKDGRKVKGIIHWASATQGCKLPVRIYDRLFVDENPDKLEDFHAGLNPDSLIKQSAWGEPALASAAPGETFQFERVGYFTVDREAAEDGRPVFNRTATLRDTWAKVK